MQECKMCKKKFAKKVAETKLVEADLFDDEISLYCHSCLELKIKSYDAGECDECNSKLVPVYPELQEAIDEGIVFYNCPNHKPGFETEEGLDPHDCAVGYYLVEPDDPDDENCWW